MKLEINGTEVLCKYDDGNNHTITMEQLEAMFTDYEEIWNELNKINIPKSRVVESKVLGVEGVPAKENVGMTLSERVQVLIDGITLAEWQLFENTHPNLYDEGMDEEERKQALRLAVEQFLSGRDRGKLQHDLAEKRKRLIFTIVKLNQTFRDLFVYCNACGEKLVQSSAEALSDAAGNMGLFHPKCIEEWRARRKNDTREVIGDGKKPKLKLVEKDNG